MEDAKKVIAKITSIPHGSSPPLQLIIVLLRALRQSKIRRSDLVVRYGDVLLKAIHGSLYSGQYVGNIEVWSIYEQIFVAALDVGNETLASDCLKPLIKKFPDSLRVKKLIGMQFEYQGEYKRARILYDTLLATNPGELSVLKRLIAAFKGEGDLVRAVEELHNVLKIFYHDQQLWEELAEIHLSMGDFPSAAFCFEELILLGPGVGAYHLRLADIYYSMGDVENCFKARKHYTMCLNIQCGRLNLRAMYGLLAAAKKLEGFAAATVKSSDKATEAESSSSAVSTSVNAAAIQSSTLLLTVQEMAVNKEILAFGREQLKDMVALCQKETIGNVLRAASDVL